MSGVDATAKTVVDPGRFDALLVDLDGVVTKTAAVHAAAWMRCPAFKPGAPGGSGLWSAWIVADRPRR